MNDYKEKLFMKLILFGLILFCFAPQVVYSTDYKDEILKLARIDMLPGFQNKIVVKQLSSYDRTGGNNDGNYIPLRKEGDNLVIADLKGAGAIQRIWTPTPSADTIQFFFDGENTPRIELPFIDLFSGKHYPFKRPVVGNEVGGYYCYLPISYSKSCKIVFKGKHMSFIQIQYRELLKGGIESFPVIFSDEEKEALKSVVDIWKRSGTNIISDISGKFADVKKQTANISIQPGEKYKIFELGKGGRIVGIEIKPLLPLNTEFKDLILKANWDNGKVPAINCPVSDFFGYAFGKPSARSMLLGVNNDLHYCYLPMPFRKCADVELEYLKNTLNKYSQIPLEITLYYTEDKQLKTEGKFYAKWNRIHNPEMGKPYPFLEETKGRGHYVGTILQAQGLNPGITSFFEGDDQCYIDGKLRLHGTGSEDYFNGGWYALADRWDQGFSLPLHGCLAYSIPMSHTGGYRFYITDKLSFEESISLTMEHGPENNNLPVDYTSVAYYYCDTPPTANKLPSEELLKRIEQPEPMEYDPQLLPVKALNKWTSISFIRVYLPGKGYNAYKIEAKQGGLAKFELDVPSEGQYEMHISYFKGPECGNFSIAQRQVPVKDESSAYSTEREFVYKEYVGQIDIKKYTNTITISLGEPPVSNENNTFLLNRIYLEKIK